MYLGIDVGTSGVKAALLDSDGSLVEQATAPLEVSRPAPMHSEQDPRATGGRRRRRQYSR
jgi:xylulokinase